MKMPKPRVLEEVIGHTEHIRTLKRWLKLWTEQGTGKPAFLSGPPGVGKTTIAHLLAAQQGYTVQEWNASDGRSAAALKTLATSNQKHLSDQFLIVMDEIDGLADHGGVAALTDILRKATIPIICIANERPQKLKTLISLCTPVLAFSRLSHADLKRILVAQAGETATPQRDRIIEAARGDARAALNALRFASGSASADNGGNKDSTKDQTYTIFTAAHAVFNRNNPYSVAESAALSDYMMVPSMIEEGYVGAAKSLKQILKAADHVLHGDVLNERMQHTQDWSLLPYRCASTVAAARTVKGDVPYNLFPSWLGKYSTRSKNRRIIQEIALDTGYTSKATRLDLLPCVDRLVLGSAAGAKAGPLDAKRAVSMLDTIGIDRDTYMDGVREVVFDPVDIASKDKSALTRTYNKTHKGKKMKVAMEADADIEEEEAELETPL